MMNRSAVVALLAILLGLLHHDGWYWDDPALVFGFMPVGLAYHALFSILAASLWAYAVCCAWPKDLEDISPGTSKKTEPRKASTNP